MPGNSPVPFQLMAGPLEPCASDVWTSAHTASPREDAAASADGYSTLASVRMWGRYHGAPGDLVYGPADPFAVAPSYGMQLELKLIDVFPGIVWTALPDGRAEYINRRWCEYVRLSQEEAVGF